MEELQYIYLIMQHTNKIISQRNNVRRISQWENHSAALVKINRSILMSVYLCNNFIAVESLYIQGVSVHKEKFEIMITVGLSYIRKHSWWLACSPIFSI